MMIKSLPLSLLAVAASLSLVSTTAQAVDIVAPAAAASAQATDGQPTAIAPAEGRMVYTATGQRLAPVYRVNTDGSVQMIMEGHLVTIPAAMLSDVNGKLTSAETKAAMLR